MTSNSDYPNSPHELFHNNKEVFKQFDLQEELSSQSFKPSSVSCDISNLTLENLEESVDEKEIKKKADQDRQSKVYEKIIKDLEHIQEAIYDFKRVLFKPEMKKALELADELLRSDLDEEKKLELDIIAGYALYLLYQPLKAIGYLNDAKKRFKRTEGEFNEQKAKLFVRLYLLLADIMIHENPEKSAKYMERAEKEIGRFFRNDKGINAEMDEIKGKLYSETKNYTESEKCSIRAKNYYEQQNNRNKIAFTSHTLAVLYLTWKEKENNFQEALKFLLRGWKAIQEDGEENFLVGRYLLRMAEIYIKYANEQQAEIKKCVKIGSEIQKKTLPHDNFESCKFEKKFRDEELSMYKDDRKDSQEILTKEQIIQRGVAFERVFRHKGLLKV